MFDRRLVNAGYDGIAPESVSQTSFLLFAIAAPSVGGWPSCGPAKRSTRRGCAGRAADASLVANLRGLVDPPARGDPESPLRWTCKSLSKLAQGLRDLGHKIGRTLIGELLHKEGYSLQSSVKTLEGSDDPDRDAQFKYINEQVKAALTAAQPVISVDTRYKGAQMGSFQHHHHIGIHRRGNAGQSRTA